jgi:hypothetical protein
MRQKWESESAAAKEHPTLSPFKRQKKKLQSKNYKVKKGGNITFKG